MTSNALDASLRHRDRFAADDDPTAGYAFHRSDPAIPGRWQLTAAAPSAEPSLMLLSSQVSEAQRPIRAARTLGKGRYEIELRDALSGTLRDGTWQFLIVPIC